MLRLSASGTNSVFPSLSGPNESGTSKEAQDQVTEQDESSTLGATKLRLRLIVTTLANRQSATHSLALCDFQVEIFYSPLTPLVTHS
jgi:hypothetical protein